MQASASAYFFMVPSGEVPISLAFATSMYRKVVAPYWSASVSTKPRGKVLIVVEIPPRGFNATGDEHAVGVVVGAVRDMGLDFVIVSRICGES